MALAMASCRAYISMNGVIRPCVSAGSNHVGASEMWTPQVIWPSGAAATGAAKATRASRTHAASRSERTGRTSSWRVGFSCALRARWAAPLSGNSRTCQMDPRVRCVRVNAWRVIEGRWRSGMRQMTLVAFLQAQNCSNYAASWRHVATAPDFLTAEYYQRIARTLEAGRF